jgi:YgiT-type zinc finger domain-containing protein
MQPAKCAECDGSVEHKTITHTQPWGDELYRFELVPAWGCTQCGHVWFDAEVSQAMDEIIRRNPIPKKYQRIPVFSLVEELEKMGT